MDVIISDPFYVWLLLGIGVALIFLEVFILFWSCLICYTLKQNDNMNI